MHYLDDIYNAPSGFSFDQEDNDDFEVDRSLESFNAEKKAK